MYFIAEECQYSNSNTGGMVCEIANVAIMLFMDTSFHEP